MRTRHCMRGIRYPDLLDVKIALAEGMLRGRRANGYHLCDRCNGYHLGQPKRDKKCWATAKVIYDTEVDAKGKLQKLKAKGRAESEYYRCKYCRGFHLTSHAMVV